MRARTVIVLLIAFWCFALAMALNAVAHHAPSGVEYPSDCCSTTDCHRVAPADVRPAAGGWWVKTFRGEVFFPAAKLRPPIDADWHECHNAAGPAGALNPLCLIPPFKGF